MTKAEIGALQLQAKKRQRSSASHYKLARKDSLTWFQGGHSPVDISVLNFQPLDCETIHFCCFEPPGLWYFVEAAPGNSYSCYESIGKLAEDRRGSTFGSYKNGTKIPYASVSFCFVTPPRQFVAENNKMLCLEILWLGWAQLV